MQQGPICPVCKGKMWDNRDSKKNPKAPDFKCRDKSCDGAVWPDDNVWGRDGSHWKKFPGRDEPGEAGPGLDESQEATVPAGSPATAQKAADAGKVSEADIESYLSLLEAVGTGWAASADKQQLPERMLPTAADIQAASATLLIQAQKRSGR